jgi:hypothetical protein
MKHINDPLPMPSKLDPSIPESFERVALKALAKQADDRYQTAMQMNDALIKAAKVAGIQIPKTITLPQTGAGLPIRPGSVAVFSGSARENIPDSDFASGDTDITYGKKFNLPKSGAGDLLDKARTFFRIPANLDQVRPQYVNRAVMYSIAAIVLANIAMIWVSGIFGWHVFGHIWPMELVVVGVLLGALMTALANYWLLIPVGIVTGNGFLFTYFSLTGLWKNWTLLWPLEPILVGLSIVLPFTLKSRGEHGRWLVRRIGIVLLALSAIVFVVSLIIGIISSR